MIESPWGAHPEFVYNKRMDDYLRSRDAWRFLESREALRLKHLQLQWVEKQRHDRGWHNPVKDRIGLITKQYVEAAKRSTR